MINVTSRRTVGSVLAEHGGYGPGFDLLRLALALLVMAFHGAAALQLGPVWESPPYWVLTDALLPMFFALSGFLISASAMRLSLGQFLLNRGLRILPALVVEITLSALIIGPLFTTLPLAAYLHDPQFRHYFTNIVGLINYNLPGLFYENGQPGIVNAALWTIPYEVICYGLISGIILLRLLQRPVILLLLIGLFTLVPEFVTATGHTDAINAIPRLGWLLLGRGTALFAAFLAGCFFYAARDRIPLHRGVFAGCLLLFLLASVFGVPAVFSSYGLSFLSCIGFAYLTVYIGLARLPKLPVISNGDYSYGIYLYHCPLINCVYYFMPGISSALLLFVTSLPLVAGFACFSWNVIEKPILQLRKKFSFVGKRLERRQTL